MKRSSLLSPLAALAGAAGVLFLSAGLLSPTARVNAQAEQNETMARLLPGSTVFLQEAYSGEDTNVRALFRGDGGFVVATTTEGYAGGIALWVGVDRSGRVTGLTVRDLTETWGLGRRAMSEEAFLAQFLGTSGYAVVGEDIDALSGATVTSKAVARGVNSAAAVVSGADVSSGATEWG